MGRQELINALVQRKFYPKKYKAKPQQNWVDSETEDSQSQIYQQPQPNQKFQQDMNEELKQLYQQNNPETEDMSKQLANKKLAPSQTVKKILFLRRTLGI